MQAAIIIYTPILSNRLQYVLEYIFTQRLGLHWQLTNDKSAFSNASSLKINYATEVIAASDIHIIPESILSEENIYAKTMALNRWKHSFVIFYNQPKGIIPFDLLGAVFYFISRYEEYLPYQKDKHQRFPATKSIAYQYHFLQQPIIDEWIIQLKKILLKIVPTLSFLEEKASWKMTVDIDLTWKYLHKSSALTWKGKIKDVLKLNIKGLKERQAVLSGKIPDPMDCFDWMAAHYKREIAYFALMKSDTQYDRNQSPEHPAMQEKLRHLFQNHSVNIHPSYDAAVQELIRAEKEKLATIIGKEIVKSRMHFIKLQLPYTYQQLIQNGIEEDYTMGYADYNGFRAGTSRPFFWFDLSSNDMTSLKIFPFIYMDATAYFYNKMNATQSLEELERLAIAVRNTNGLMIGIWHNYLIGDALEYPGQRTLWLQSIERLDGIFKD